MKVFVIAMDCEAECVTSHLAGATEELLYGRRVVRGKLGGDDAVVVVSGIGKSNAAAATQLAIQLTGADAVLNVGVAGGIDSSMEVGGLYEVREAVQYDFDLALVNGTEKGVLNERKTPFIPCTQLGRFPAKVLGTGDRFTDGDSDMPLLSHFGVGLRDMEGAAMAHVCETAGVKFASLKCVTNVEGSGSMTGQYAENLKACLAKLSEAVRQVWG